MERERPEQVLELLTTMDDQSDEPQMAQTSQLQGVVCGVISEFDPATGTIYIVLPRLSMLEPMVARSTVALSQSDVGKEVLVAFEAGAARVPYIIGLLWPQEQHPPAEQLPLEAKVDGERVVLEAQKEIVLKCGKASITLTRAGKVLIRGAYVLSRSSGVNRVKGGSVQIN